jgi:hypothetical protein
MMLMMERPTTDDRLNVQYQIQKQNPESKTSSSLFKPSFELNSLIFKL